MANSAFARPLHVNGMLQYLNSGHLIYYFTVFTAAHASPVQRLVGADGCQAFVNEVDWNVLPGCLQR